MLDFVTELASREVVPHVLSLSLGSLSPYSCDLLCTKAVASGGVTLPKCQAFLQTQRPVCMYLDTAQVRTTIPCHAGSPPPPLLTLLTSRLTAADRRHQQRPPHARAAWSLNLRLLRRRRLALVLSAVSQRGRRQGMTEVPAILANAIEY